MEDATSKVVSVARSLAQFFYEQGCYTALAGFAGYKPHLVPAGAEDNDVEATVREEPAFAGLAVQTVACSSGEKGPKVHIYLTRSSKKLEKTLPKEIDGVPIVLARMGRIVVIPGKLGSANFFEHGGRVACGSSCAPAGEAYAGTFGALVRKSVAGGIFCLSNNHVIAACNHVAVGQPILAPATRDAGPYIAAPRQIARHAEIIELRSGVPELVPVNRADAALGRVVDTNMVTSWQGDEDHGYDTPSTIADPVSGMRVKKFGRTTGLTTGTIEAMTIDNTPLPYKCRFFNATAWFTEVWTVRGDAGPFAIAGDSGSLVVSEDGTVALGLIFAAAGDYGIMIPMNYVQTLFGGVELVSEHNV
ncbi:MAG: hypothetical protein JWL59_3115 [Chthoniobacteraceae bacterium]|nr:hypothetical protein [Chthoniobacteraceae bacterium]